jgi:hypothetical protein
MAMLVLSVSAVLGQGNVVRFDFETGDLQGWKVVEGSFGMLVCDRARFHNTGEIYNKQGKYFLSTLEQADGTPNDGFTGVVQSPVFRLAGPDMSFLVGGGDHPDTYVAICTLDGLEIAQGRGKNTETMQRVQWRLPELVGKEVYLRVVDGNTGGWGHVTFDDFTAAGTIDPEATQRNFASYESVLDQLKSANMPSPGNPATLRAAISDLSATFGERYPKAGDFLTRLGEIEKRLQATDKAALRRAKADFAALQKEALIANPLVSGQPLLYVSRAQYVPDHHNTETMFQTNEINTGSFRGPGALKVIDFAKSGQVRTLVDAPQGIVRDPDVYFTGQKIIFSMRRNINEDYHLWEVNADGSGLKQLTSAPGVTDIDPIYMPDDTIIFSGTREPKYCMCNRHIMANLYHMDGDGANVVQIGKSTLMEEHGSLMPDGRVLYDRWEYVDRDFGDAQGLWTVNPDGTDHAVYWGNNKPSPGAVLDAKVIPGSERVVCTFGSCHDRPWGAIAILDRRQGLDQKEAVVRTWPTKAVDLFGVGDFDTYSRVYPKYEDPYPLSDPATGAGAGKYFLCSRMVGNGEQMGIYLLDVFGNEIPLITEPPGCFDPRPLAPKPRPATIPTRRDFQNKEGYFYIADVYLGTHMAGVERGEVKYLRVVESPEKRQWTYPNWNGQGSESAAMNWHDFNNKRILGTVPVAEDGSACVAVPSDTYVYFQLLDKDGMMVQSMRSGTIVQSGEWQGCVGCHEDRRTAPPVRIPSALRRTPARLDGWHGAPRLFSYTQEVQPVFDRNCASCHDYGKPAGQKLVLSGDRDLIFNASYNELWRKGYIHDVGAGPAQVQQAKSWGSHASKIVEVLRAGHHDVNLDAESLDRIITWIDLNAPYYPTYASAYPDNPGGRSPLTDAQVKRLEQLTGAPLLSFLGFNVNPGPQISFERPEVSPCLAKLDPHSDAFREAVALIVSGAQMLAKQPRGDGATFEPGPLDQKREEKYAMRRQVEMRNREAVREGKKVYDGG